MLEGAKDGNPNWYTSQTMMEAKTSPQWWYGGNWKDETNGVITSQDANVAVGSGERVDDITFNGIQKITDPNADYKWSMTMSESNLTDAIGLGDDPDGTYQIGIYWGGAGCSNDGIYGVFDIDLSESGVDPIPEPGTLLLLGFGLLGIAGYGIHRKKKSS
jgi:hypothetical protein